MADANVNGGMPAINSTADVQASLNAAGSIPLAGTGQQSTKAQSKIQDFNNQSVTNPPKPKNQPEPKEEDKKEQEQEAPLPNANTPDMSALVSGANSFFSNISVEKGLGIAFILLIFLIWMLVPTASGYTRLQLLWFTLLGQTKLSTKPDQTTPIGPNQSQVEPQQPTVTQAQGPDQSQIGPTTNNVFHNIDVSALNSMEFD